MGNTERAVILAKIEATYGTDSTPGVTNAIVTSAPTIKINGEKLERNVVSPSMSPWARAQGMLGPVDLSFDVELRGYGAAYSASNLPEVSPLLRACGLDETVDVTVGLEKVTYQPVSTGQESCTIYFYDDGFLYKAIGCRGSVKFACEAGKRGVANFTMQALYAAPADGALVSPTYQDITVQPPPFLSAGFTFGGNSRVISKLELDLAVELAKRLDANAANGIVEILVTGRDPKGSIDPEAVALSTEDYFTHWSGDVEKALVATLGGTQYNRVKFDVPKAQIESVDPAEREKLRTWGLPFVCNRDTGDDEVVITFD